MKVTIDICNDDVALIKSFLADQAQRRQAASKIASDPKEVRRFQIEAEFCKDTFNDICDVQNWELHQERQKLA
jgi:hypothetical protein